MTRKTSAVAGGDVATDDQYNFLRDEAGVSSYLMAYADGTTNTVHVLINPGKAYFGKDIVEFAGGNSGLFTEPSNSNRIDIVAMDSGGTINVTEGTEADTPTAPAVPDDETPIAQIYNRAGQTKITEVDDSSNGYILKDIREHLKKYKGFRMIEEGTFTNSFEISGLNGDDAHIYELHIRYTNTTTPRSLGLTFNNDTGANYSHAIHEAGESGDAEIHSVTRAEGQNNLQIGPGASSGQIIATKITIYAKSNNRRLVRWETLYDNGTLISFYTITGLGIWTNTADEITVIDAVLSGAVTNGEYYLFALTH